MHLAGHTFRMDGKPTYNLFTPILDGVLRTSQYWSLLLLFIISFKRKSHPAASLYWGSWSAVLECSHLFFRSENLERTCQIFLYFHQSSAVVELATVVRRWEDRNQLLFAEKLIAIFDHLVCPTNEIEVVLLQKGRNNVRPKNVADSSFGFPPHLNHWIWISPQKITKETCIWNISWPGNLIDLGDRSKLRWKTAMHAEYFVLDDGRNRHTVKAIYEGLPEFGRVPIFA